MSIKRQCEFTAMIITALMAASPVMRGAPPTATVAPAPLVQMVVTVQPAHQGGGVPNDLQASDLTILEGNTPVPVVRLQRLAGDLAGMQLFVLLDDSTRSSSLSLHFPELRTFLNSLPATTNVAVGYVRNGTLALPQAFTADHEKAADALRLPLAIPGVNGSPYFGLSDLVKHWPSKEAIGRKAVLMLTDGVDRYYDTEFVDDPYVDAAVQDALKNGVAVYSIYVRGAGLYGRSDLVTNFAQSRLSEVSQKTGGYAYFEDFTDPVTITPFLNDFRNRLENQYAVTFEALSEHGVQPVKLRKELPDLKIECPSRVFVR
jgi:hypothetical protein